MGHLVAHDRGQFRIVGGVLEDASVDEDLASRQNEGVGHVLVNDEEFPLEVRARGHGRNALADASDLGVDRGVLAQFLFLEDFPRSLFAERQLLTLADHHDLRAAGVGRGGAVGQQKGQHQGRKDKKKARAERLHDVHYSHAPARGKDPASRFVNERMFLQDSLVRKALT